MDIGQPREGLPAVAAVDARGAVRLGQRRDQRPPGRRDSARQPPRGGVGRGELVEEQHVLRRDGQRPSTPSEARWRGQAGGDHRVAQRGLPRDDQRQPACGPHVQATARHRVPRRLEHMRPALRGQPDQLLAPQRRRQSHGRAAGIGQGSHRASSTRWMTSAAMRRPPRCAPSCARRSAVSRSASAARRPAARSPSHSERTPPIAT